MTIDLRSDTVTRPTPAMLEAMMQAEVGDDVFGEDPGVNALQEEAAAMFGHEAALFCPSGTQTNQIAIRTHTQPGDEVICDQLSHVYQYEGGGIAANAGASVRLLQGERGIVTPGQIEEAIQPDNIHHPVSRLVVLENTCNKGGGTFYTLTQIRSISQMARQRGLAVHLDGARIFNALLASGDAPSAMGPLFDSISICLSKGLGAPVGSLLIGSRAFISKAKRIRKVMGGGMRQAGYLAAAGHYALQHHINRLEEDHQRARQLGEALSALPFVEHLLPVETNIVVFQLASERAAQGLLQFLAQHDIKAVPFGRATLRMVTHLDIDDAMVARTIEVLQQFQPD